LEATQLRAQLVARLRHPYDVRTHIPDSLYSSARQLALESRGAGRAVNSRTATPELLIVVVL